MLLNRVLELMLDLRALCQSVPGEAFQLGIVVEIVENYRDWEPPFDVRRVVSRLLAGTPSRYQIGLATVVLTNASGLSHDRRRGKTWWRGRKVAVALCRGSYHREWQGEPAWIEVLVDNTVQGVPSWLLKLPIMQDSILANVLFHEIGHHLHATQAPEYRERERVAEKWERRLWREYSWKHYWYVLPWIYPFYLGFRIWNKVRPRLGSNKAGGV